MTKEDRSQIALQVINERLSQLLMEDLCEIQDHIIFFASSFDRTQRLLDALREERFAGPSGGLVEVDRR